MPAWGKSGGGLTAEQVKSLVEYLANGSPGAKVAPTSVSRSGNAARGGELFAQVCAGCHGSGNQLAPVLANPVFQKTASDDFIVRTIQRGRPDTAMPAFQRAGADGLSDGEIVDLLAYLRSPGKK